MATLKMSINMSALLVTIIGWVVIMMDNTGVCDAFAPPTTMMMARQQPTTTSSILLQYYQARSQHNHNHHHISSLAAVKSQTLLYMAGGFEWEDPTEAFDQGVDNPYKNPALMKGTSTGEDGGELMKVDPARLLGPRLNGSNLYLVGMMGTGKSSVGDKVARSESSVLCARRNSIAGKTRRREMILAS
jgi:hypothetical protein